MSFFVPKIRCRQEEHNAWKSSAKRTGQKARAIPKAETAAGSSRSDSAQVREDAYYGDNAYYVRIRGVLVFNKGCPYVCKQFLLGLQAMHNWPLYEIWPLYHGNCQEAVSERADEEAVPWPQRTLAPHFWEVGVWAGTYRNHLSHCALVHSWL